MSRRLLLTFLCLAYSSAYGAELETSISGRLDITGGLSLAPAGSNSGRQSLQTQITTKSPDIEARILGRARYLQLEGYPPRETEIREAVLGVRRTDYNLLIGRQQVVWGKMDVVRFTDSVNPVDTADLFYEDLVDARIPLWMANLEWFSENKSLQLLVIPDSRFNRLPRRQMSVPVEAPVQPGNEPKNWSYGAKFGFQPGDWTIELSALRAWEFNPVSTISVEPSGPVIRQRYTRQTRLGMTAETRLGKTILRIESLYTPREFFSPSLPASPEAPSSPVLRFGAGLDVEVSNFFLSGQLLREQATRAIPAISTETRRTYASFLAQRKFLQDRLGLRFFVITGLDHRSNWLSLQSIYQIGGNHELKLQLDRFDGEQGSLFGEFRDRDRLAMTYTYRF
jgi:hypothetical protein